MPDTLSTDQIAALFEAAKSGEIVDGQSGQQRRTQRMRSVDFSRPTKFTADHQRRITRAVDGFCLGAASRLTGELRQLTEFETLNTTQVTWVNAQSLIPTNSLAVTLLVEPLGTRILMTIESSFVLNAIECLLGGGSQRAAKSRRFSEIDWTLSRRLLESIVHQLSVSWSDLGGLSFTIEDMELQNHDATSLASVSDPTLMVMIEARMNIHSAAMTLLIPWVAIDPVADLIAGRDHVRSPGDGDSVIDRALSRAPVTVRAEIAALDLPISDILSLQPGSVIRLGAPAGDGISLYAENVRLGRAQPGSNGVRRAVQIRTDEL